MVVLYDMVQNITDAQKAKFLSLFDKGIGLVVLHHALVSYQHWPDFERIIGGRYPEADGKSGVVTTEVGYEHDVDIPVVLVSQNHPVSAQTRCRRKFAFGKSGCRNCNSGGQYTNQALK